MIPSLHRSKWPAVRFEPDGHRYFLAMAEHVPEVPVPSVTGIIKPLSPYLANPSAAQVLAMAHGKAFHEVLAEWEAATSPIPVEPHYLMGLSAWREWLGITDATVMLREAIVGCTSHPTWYAGTLDRMLWSEKLGGFVLVDVKTGSPNVPYCYAQLAGYERAAKQTFLLPDGIARWIVWNVDLNTGSYKTHQATQPQKIEAAVAFDGCLGIQAWRARHGLS